MNRGGGVKRLWGGVWWGVPCRHRIVCKEASMWKELHVSGEDETKGEGWGASIGVGQLNGVR